ncbi:acyltransferase family protein [Actinacidiphila sp. bgisy145]|uniref:acyltransferase family protein n=1 Tax=Actinacidiphila sp. bgisy145 TaxID=3413792 RepID=UPI003EBCFB2C
MSSTLPTPGPPPAPPQPRPAAPAAPAAPEATGAPAPAAQQPPAPPARLRALDGLRLVAALMVASYHYVVRGGDAWNHPIKHMLPHVIAPAAYGPLGVQFFFIISGFVICMSGWGRTVKAFTVSRISRLYPAYWAALILVAAVLYVIGKETVSRTDLITNFTMLQTPAGAKRQLGVSWTLWAELRFYALFALTVLWRGATQRRVLAFCALWTLGAVYAQGSGESFLQLALMPDYAPFFVGGIGLYLVHRFGHDLVNWSVVAVGFLLGQQSAVKALVAPPGSHPFYQRSPTVVIVLVAAGFAAIAAATLVPRVARVEWRWLTTAGALTYPFYLVHEILGTEVIDRLEHHTSLPASAVLVLAVLSMLVLAWLIYRLVEKPLGPLLRRRLSVPLGSAALLRTSR